MNLFMDKNKTIEQFIEKMDILILDRAFTGNARFRGNRVYLTAKNEKEVPINIDLFFERISSMIDAAYTEFDKHYKNLNDKNVYELFIDFAGMTVLSERTERFLNNDSKEYNDVVEKIHHIYDLIKEELPSDFSKLMAVTMSDSDNYNKVLKTTFNINKLNDDDIMFIIENYIGKEDFKKYLSNYLETLYTNKSIMEKLEKNEYINPAEVRSYIGGESLVNALKEKNSQHILRYLQTCDFFEAFSKGYISSRVLENNTTIEDLLCYSLNKKSIMDVLEKKIYKTDATELIWELYEKDFFTDEDITKIYNLECLNTNNIINKYCEEHKRKIALELNGASISDEKIADFFTIERVLELAKSANSQEYTDFINNELNLIYQNKGIDLQRALIDKEKEHIENSKNNKDAKTENLLDLCKKGIVDLSKFTSEDISEEEIIKFYNEQNDDNIIVEAYNNGMISQETVLEQFEDEEILLEKINSGLNPNVLMGYYQTSDLLKFFKSGKISVENLSKFKGYLDVYKISSLYLSGNLDYEDLFGSFVKFGVIDYQTASKINDQYDIELALEKLRKSGGIVGQDIDLARSAQDKNVKSKDYKDKKQPNGAYEKDDPYGMFNINNELSNQLFESLGAGEKVKVCCKLFDGYIMVPFVDKKLALLEGDGRTYIMPLKIVLEQVEHQGSENDLIGNATYRSDLYNNTEYVRTANHTNNWGRNVIKRMGELNPTIDVKKLLDENSKTLAKLEQQYCERKKQKNR